MVPPIQMVRRAFPGEEEVGEGIESMLQDTAPEISEIVRSDMPT